MTATISLDQVNRLSGSDFIALLGGVFEHSPWVAQAVADARPFSDIDSLHRAMVAAIANAPAHRQMELIRAHPQLAGKAAIARTLTAHSTSEQAGAGLDQCSPEEYATLNTLNQAYERKFGFPFILAVRGHNRQSIITQFRARLQLTPEDEKRECLEQIYRIGRFRLEDLITT